MWPWRKPQTLHPDTEDDQPSSSPSPTSPSPCPLSQLQQQPWPTGSAVKAKVKALSERNKTAFKAGMDKKASHVPSSLFSPSLVSLCSSSSDDDAESQGYTFSPVVPHSLIEGSGMAGLDFSLLALPRGLGEGSGQENRSVVNANASPLEDDVSSANVAKPWGQQRKAKGHSRVGRELLRRDSLEGLRRGELGSQGATVGLWRANSLESVCSNRSSISLAERVEMNRGLLKQILNKSQGPEPGSKENLEREQKAEEVTPCNGRDFITLNDSDWDSGISLQDSEHSRRAFVSSEDLPLSQRHEQAKQLLERARMKARSCPLKADHTILPIQRDNPEQLSMAGAPFRRALLAGKGGVSSAIVAAVTSSGNLSDSSSGDSACCPRRRPGQSPTRVRFEDESEKDAEVRYLERLRQRRAAQGLLKSKPNLSSYVNGWMDTDPGTGIEQGRCLEGSFLWHKKARRTQEGYVNRGSRGHFKAAVAQEALNRQCNSCGTFLEGGVPNLNLHLNPSPPKGQNGPVNGEGKGKLLMSCWVAPSEPSQAVLTELIKEKYIGKVTLRDVADSTGTWRGWAGETDSGSVRVSTMKVKRRSRRGEILETNGHGAPITVSSTPPRSNHSLAPVSSTNGIVVVPPNPYTIEKPVSMVVGLHTHSPAPPEEPTNCPPCLKGTPFPPSSLPIKPTLKTGPKTRPNGQLSVKHMPSPQYRILTQDSLEDQGRGAAPSPQNEHSVGGNFKEVGLTSSTIMPCIRPASLLKTSPSPAKMAEEKLVHPAPQTPEVELQHPWMGELSLGGANIITPPRYHSGCDGQVMGPMRTEHQREDSTSPAKMVGTETTEQQEARSKLSLRRLFSAIGLNGVGKLGKRRSSSMEQLSSKPRGVRPAFPGPSSSCNPSPARPEPRQLRKAPSLQSLHMGSPFKQLRKSSSVQNLQSSKEEGDRSSAYTPGDQPSSPALSKGLQRVLSVEDVGSPSGVRSVGRVARAFSDGTLLLELSRPPKGHFGFLISRGKGRPDSGVYVEEMGDSSTVKMYGGLLGVGDELLEVNGEKVAGLSGPGDTAHDPGEHSLCPRASTQEAPPSSLDNLRTARHRGEAMATGNAMETRNVMATRHHSNHKWKPGVFGV